jgi:hypothetical protein
LDEPVLQEPPVGLRVRGEARAAAMATHQVHQPVDAAVPAMNALGQVPHLVLVAHIGNLDRDAGMAAVSSDNRCGDRPTATTVAPASFNARTAARPAEPVAPVTTTTRPPTSLIR